MYDLGPWSIDFFIKNSVPIASLVTFSASYIPVSASLFFEIIDFFFQTVQNLQHSLVLQLFSLVLDQFSKYEATNGIKYISQLYTSIFFPPVSYQKAQFAAELTDGAFSLTTAFQIEMPHAGVTLEVVICFKIVALSVVISWIPTGRCANWQECLDLDAYPLSIILNWGKLFPNTYVDVRVCAKGFRVSVT